MPHTFTDRRGGNSTGAYQGLNFGLHVGDNPVNVLANRNQFVGTQFMNQVHGENVVVATHLLDQDPTCDALVTTNPDITLAVMVADCIPLLLISKEVVAAVHVGRAGVVNQIAIKTIQKMRELGANQMHGILGPSICGKCYEVPIDLQSEIVALQPKALAWTHQQTPSLDLPAALIAQLVGAGATYEASMICTMEDPIYFSHRRDAPTGRFAGFVSL